MSLPQEVIDLILIEHLKTMAPVDWWGNYPSYYRALRPFNINRSTRAGSVKLFARYLRFVGTLSIDPSEGESVGKFHSPPLPLASLHHLHIRISLDAAYRNPSRNLGDIFGPPKSVAACLTRHDVFRLVRETVNRETITMLQTITYSLDAFTRPDELAAWLAIGNYWVVETVVRDIKLATPTAIPAKIMLELEHSPTRITKATMLSRCRIGGLAGNILRCPDRLFDVEDKEASLEYPII